MLKYIILFFLVSVFLFACRNDNPVPANVIDPNVMVSLLTEVHIVDGRLYNYTQTPDTLRKYGAPEISLTI